MSLIVVSGPPKPLGSSTPAANAYWVSPTGAATWANARSTTPLSGIACASLSTMRTASVSPGDVIYLRGGAYSYNTAATLIAPSSSGTSGSRITYSAYADEAPVITNINAGTGYYGVLLNGISYISVSGITFIDFPRQVDLRNGSSYNEIAYCDISRTSPIVATAIGIHVRNGDSAGLSPSLHNWIHHNVIHGFYLAAPGEGGDGISIGQTGDNKTSNYNTVEYNTIYDCGHTGTENFTQFNVFRGNFVHNNGFKTSAANITGTATGGSTTRLIDTTKDFTALGVKTGTFIAVHDMSDPGSGRAKGALIATITTTTNPNDTLTYTANGSATPNFAAGHSYSIGPLYFVDTNPPGDSKYGHRNFHCDTQSGQRSQAFADCILIEGNRGHNSASNPGNDAAEGLALSAGRCIVRFNEFAGNGGPGIYTKNGIVCSDNRIYRNTIANNGRFLGTQSAGNPIVGSGVEVHALATNNKFVENIFWNNKDGDFDTSTPVSWTVANNHRNADGDPLFTNLDLSDYTSTSLPDLSLQAGSSARNAGSSLTTAVGAGVASTALVVSDSFFFQDGTWGSSLSDIQPDWIAIGTVGNVVQISNIDYATHAITLASAASWSDGASIWLYKKSDGALVLLGSAPDRGAREAA